MARNRALAGEHAAISGGAVERSGGAQIAPLLGAQGLYEFEHDGQRVMLRQGYASRTLEPAHEQGWWVVRPDDQAAIGPFRSQEEALSVASCHFSHRRSE